jgi:hypothetical protein
VFAVTIAKKWNSERAIPLVCPCPSEIWDCFEQHIQRQSHLCVHVQVRYGGGDINKILVIPWFYYFMTTLLILSHLWISRSRWSICLWVHWVSYLCGGHVEPRFHVEPSIITPLTECIDCIALSCWINKKLWVGSMRSMSRTMLGVQNSLHMCWWCLVGWWLVQ